MELAKPQLAKVFRAWLGQELPEDIFNAVTFSGASLVDPRSEPIEWELSFETTGDKWLGITIPFKGSQAGEAIVDT